MVTASFLLCLRHCCAGHFCHSQQEHGVTAITREKKEKQHFQCYWSFSILLPSLHSKRSWETPPSPLPPLPSPFSYPRSSPCTCTPSSSDQQNSGFPTLLRNPECVVLSHVFTSHRTQHEGYTEVYVQIPFFCKNETFFTQQLNFCHPFKTVVIFPLI